jgi:hypothetical protein
MALPLPAVVLSSPARDQKREYPEICLPLSQKGDASGVGLPGIWLRSFWAKIQWSRHYAR